MVHHVKELGTSDVDEFHAGLLELVDFVHSTLTAMGDKYHVLVNLPGRFSGTQGAQPAAAVPHADQVWYALSNGWTSF